jgi:molecular chaperone DnaK (HSP70)
MSGGQGGGQDLCPELQVVLLDVTPLSLGIELEGKVMSTLIKRNTPIPCRKSREYTTVEDFQTELDVVVYEGERATVDGNNKLGEFRINGIERVRKGEAKIEVCFNLDANGILNVTARDLVTQAEASATMAADKGRLTDEEIAKMVEDAEKYRDADNEAAKKVRIRNALEEAMYTCMSRDSNTDADTQMLTNLQEWLDYDAENASMERIEKQVESLKQRFGVVLDFEKEVEPAM